jgi:hypothetical protein
MGCELFKADGPASEVGIDPGEGFAVQPGLVAAGRVVRYSIRVKIMAW